jgi:hypothetical protein
MSHCFCKGVSKLELAATRATTRLVVRDHREEGLIDQLAAVGCIDGRRKRARLLKTGIVRKRSDCLRTTPPTALL